MFNPFATRQPSVFVALADTPASQRLHHRLRYQVYCQKLAYEDAARFPGGEERDRYDEYSVHFVAYDRRSNDWAGTLRLVRPNPAGLPLTSVTRITPEIQQLVELDQVLEISRVCVHTLTPVVGCGERPRAGELAPPASSTVFFALVRASVAYAFQAGASQLAFLTATPLIRLLKRLGIHHTAAGETCFHRGLRHPRVLDVAEQFRNLIEAVSDHPLAPHLPFEPYRPYSSLSGAR